MERLNQVLFDLVRKKGTNKKVAEPLGITPQALGKYLKGRKLPLTLVKKWKEVYGDDLLKLAEGQKEPNVSRETNNGEVVKTLPMDAWELLQKNFSQFEKNSELVNSEVVFLREVIRNLTRQGVNTNKP